ncbi:glycosyl transferase [Zhouia spongiae]|uniref:Glycosyl transferase n=1 Tax=Zhouia spongiae TaxID=2202721 RepID=A0ABY3YKP4_9FLAO|nr:ATP-grasp fold amidoligase family protein [Zhouia spongiae]UNY98397.1 glycosyl transferase [Zhouia spongiae]
MRAILKKWSAENSILNYLIKQSLLIRNSITPLKWRLKTRFVRKLGYRPNFDNPHTFNEKIQWLKLNDRSTLHTLCADKYRVRAYVEKKIGDEFLVPLLLQTNDISDLKPENMPDFPVIIKTNHDSSGGAFIWNKNDIDWPELRKKFKKRLSYNYDYGKGEWQYKNIEPCIIVEKLLIDENGNIPFDYKLHCFNGKVAFIQVDIDRATNHKRNLYDSDWNFIDCKWVYDNGREVPEPAMFEKMKELAEEFAKDFLYVRVDQYVIGDKIFFGELTFHSESGNGKFYPPEWDSKIGEWLELPLK